MARGFCLLGDTNGASPPGITKEARQQVFYVNSILVVCEGSKVSNHGHDNKHKNAKTTGSVPFFINSLRVTVEKDPDTCGHKRENNLNSAMFINS